MKQFRLLTLLVLLMTAATGAWATDGIACSASDIGKVLCTDGSIYATVGDATTAQKTAAAMIAYIDATNNKGLAIALADESGMKNYEAAGTACSGKTAVTGGTWRLPSEKDWQYMFIGCGSSESYSAPTNDMSKSYSGLASKLTTAQGDALQAGIYWSSTEYLSGNLAWDVLFGGSLAKFYCDVESNVYRVRACLAFDVTSTYTVSLNDGTENPTTWTASTDGTNFGALPLTGLEAGTAVTVKYNGRLKVKSVKATSDAAPAKTLAEATSEDIGKVVCAAGHLHAAKTAVPSGCTAVGILGKVTETGHGLILALQDATQQTWNTINGWTSVTTYAGTTLKLLPAGALGSLTSYTTLGSTTVSNWCVAQKSDYDAIFQNLGSTQHDQDGYTYDANVNAYITTGVGGTPISDDYNYWSATKYNGSGGWFFFGTYWNSASKDHNFSLRPVLGF